MPFCRFKMLSYRPLFKIIRDLINKKKNNKFNKNRRKTTISDLPTECMQQIFNYTQEHGERIYPALLVNRYWCRNIVPLLWKYPFKRFSKEYHSQPTQYLKNRILRFYQQSNNKLLSILFSCLPDNLILSFQLSQSKYRNKIFQQTLFNYPYFLQEFSYNDLELVILSSLQCWHTNTLPYPSFYSQIHLISAALCKLFFQESNLRSLYLEKNFAKLDIPNFAETYNGRPILSQLSHFSFTHSESITQNILNFLKIISSSCTHITFLEFKLKFADYNIDIRETIINIIKSQNNLTRISIEDIFTEDGAEQIIFSLKNHTMNLVSLRLSRVQLTKSCIDLISQFNNLAILVLNNCKGLSNDILCSHFDLRELIINSQQQDITLPLLRKFGKNLKCLGLSIYDLNIAEKLLSFCPHAKKIYLNIYTEEGYIDYEELKRKEKSWKHIIKSAYPHRDISLSIGY